MFQLLHILDHEAKLLAFIFVCLKPFKWVLSFKCILISLTSNTHTHTHTHTHTPVFSLFLSLCWSLSLWWSLRNWYHSTLSHLFSTLSILTRKKIVACTSPMWVRVINFKEPNFESPFCNFNPAARGSIHQNSFSKLFFGRQHLTKRDKIWWQPAQNTR